MEISATLLAFLKDWLVWAEGNHKDPQRYRKHAGLCCSTSHYVPEHDVLGYLASELVEELGQHFEEQGLDADYPFGYHNYTDAFEHDTQHLCPVRLSWVHDMIKAGDAQHGNQ